MDRNAVLTIVCEQLGQILELEPSTISESSTFAELDADSLALIELVEALEEAFSEVSEGFRIDDEDLEGLKSVGDAVNYVSSKLGAG
ncbi:MAG: acyl carrier protein [Actinomycetota bacterium]